MRKTAYEVLCVVVLTLSLCTALFSEPAQYVALHEILQAHEALPAWTIAPVSIQITGVSTRGGTAEPVTITATRYEEVLIQYGARERRVTTPSANFRADASKVTSEDTPGGFAQMDVTGLFLVAQLAERGAAVGAAEETASPGLRRITVWGNRSELHYRRFTVRDILDLYIDASGRLAGIVRQFYPDEPQYRHTVSLAFSDYRKTGGVLLPYRIERFLQGKSMETLTVEAYAFDVPAGRAMFAKRRMQ
jgi:hypothetical protein